jgi:hypothetical protein
MNLSIEQTAEEGEDEDNFNSPKDSDRDSMIQRDNHSEELNREQPAHEFYDDDHTKLKSKLLVESQSSDRHF